MTKTPTNEEKTGGTDVAQELKLPEIARRIAAHLARAEADPTLNKVNPHSKSGSRKYHHAVSYQAGPKLAVVYVSYQGATLLTKAEALVYLAWLDAGNSGKYFGGKHLACPGLARP